MWVVNTEFSANIPFFQAKPSLALGLYSLHSPDSQSVAFCPIASSEFICFFTDLVILKFNRGTSHCLLNVPQKQLKQSAL